MFIDDISITGNIFTDVKIDSISKNLCIGDTFNLHVSVKGYLDSGNYFYIQLSDSLGNFTNTDTIGRAKTNTSGLVKCYIAANIVSSNKYKLRLFSNTNNSIADTISNLG